MLHKKLSRSHCTGQCNASVWNVDHRRIGVPMHGDGLGYLGCWQKCRCFLNMAAKVCAVERKRKKLWLPLHLLLLLGGLLAGLAGAVNVPSIAQLGNRRVCLGQLCAQAGYLCGLVSWGRRCLGCIRVGLL